MTTPRDRRKANQHARAARRHDKLAEKAGTLPCKVHGRFTWAGALYCSACGAVFQASDPDAPLYAGPSMTVCTCGAKLKHPDPKVYTDPLIYTARVLCPYCFDFAVGTDGKHHEPSERREKSR